MRTNTIVSTAVLRELAAIKHSQPLTQKQKKRLSWEFMLIMGLVTTLGSLIVYNVLNHGMI